jgi:putative ABC transport system substrate-binding protein
VERRRFLLTSLAGALAAPLAAVAQQAAKVARIGLLLAGAPPDPNVEAFRDGLREFGYVEGQNLAIDYRWAGGRTDLWPELAGALIKAHIDVIVAQATGAALAAKRLTATIPIVMAYAADPVETGLVASLARPGGNVTGLTTLAPTLSAKRLEILKEAFPNTSRVAVLRLGGRDVPSRDLFWKETQRAGQALGLALIPEEVTSPDQYQSAFAAFARGRASALITLGDFILSTRQQTQIVELMLQHRLPAIYQGRGAVDVGGLMSYGPSLPVLHRRAATYVNKILQGAKPSTLPVEQPTKFELLINVKTAKALGLTIPPSLLARADQVLE